MSRIFDLVPRALLATLLGASALALSAPGPAAAVSQGRAPVFAEPTIYSTEDGFLGSLQAGPEPHRRRHLGEEAPARVGSPPVARDAFLDPAFGLEPGRIGRSRRATRSPGPAPALDESFPGLGPQGDNTPPPDSAIAVGLDHIVLAINDDFAILDRNGNLLFQDDFNNIGGYFSRQYFDPRCSYDPVDDRFLCTVVARRASTSESWWMLMVSDDDNPIGDWYVYHLDATIFGDLGVANDVWADRPYLGWDREAIYLSANMATWAAPQQLVVAKLRILDKAEIYDGNPVDWWDIWGFQSLGSWDYSVVPAQMQTWTGTTYLMSAKMSGGDTLTLIRIQDPLDWVGGPLLGQEIVDVSPYSVPPSPIQPSGDGLSIAGNFLEDKIVRMGPYLYAAHHTGVVFRGSREEDVALKIYRLNITDQQAAVSIDAIYGFPGVDFYMPSVQPTVNHDMAIAFNASSATAIFPELRYTVWQNGVGPSPSARAKQGAGSYTNGSWGDYSAAQLDPIDGETVWFMGEYSLGNTNWDIWVGAVHVP